MPKFNARFSASAILCWMLLAFSALGQSQNVARVVPTSADLVAQPPETLAATLPGAAFSYVTTSGDTVAGTGKKSWYWSPAAAFATNTAANGGPIAYPYGSGTGRWLFVPETGLTGITGSGTSGEVPAWTGSGTVGAVGLSTNSLRNVSKVVLTSAELVAQSPAELAATTGGSLAFVTTTGDITAGTGVRHWRWNSASTATTNAAASGGPIAYPYGGATGRWEQAPTASLPASSYRLMTIPVLYPDDASGVMNASDPAPNIQSYYDAASAAYDPILGPVVVDHPSNTFTGGELQLKSNVIYNSDGVFWYKKRYQPSGTTQRSVVTTVRLGGASLDPTDGSFLSWNAAGGTNNYYAVADRWYGNADNIRFTGKGKFIFDQNKKDLTQPLVRLLEVRNLFVAPGVVESWLNASTNGSPINSYGIQLCGRNVVWFAPIIRGGDSITQDGLHIGWGYGINIIGGYAQSGDDSLAFQAEASGGSTLPPDEPLENVNVSNWHADPLRARACVIHSGVNWINAPYVNRTTELRNVVVDGIFGYVSKLRQSALQMGQYQDGSGVWGYTNIVGGSGYTDGYYWLPITSTGGGSGAAAVIKVVGGSVVRAYPAKGGNGAGYLVNHAGTYSIGETNITVDTGSGTILAGDKVRFTGDPNTYTVWSSLSSGSFNLTSGIAQTLADNTAVTVTSSASAWKTGTGYTQDQSVIIDGLVPGGSGASVTGVVYGMPNNRIVNCAITNFKLISGGESHDGTEPYGIRLHGATKSTIGPGFITLIESTNSPAHRPLFVQAAQDCVIRNVVITGSAGNGTQNGGSISTVSVPKSVVDGLTIIDCQFDQIRNSGNGNIKVNGVGVGRVSLIRDKFLIGSSMSGLYMPDYESSKTCYTTNLVVEGCEFNAVPGATSTQAVNFVANAGGTGLVCGNFSFLNNTLTGITTFDTAAVMQAACAAYDIRGNRGGFRTELWFTVTQTSGTTSISVPINTYTGLIDTTTDSLPVISITPYGNVGSQWWLTPNTTTSATINTASAVGANIVWGVRINSPNKPLVGY